MRVEPIVLVFRVQRIYGRASTVDEQYVKVIRDEEVALPSSTPLASKLGKLAALASRVKKSSSEPPVEKPLVEDDDDYSNCFLDSKGRLKVKAASTFFFVCAASGFFLSRTGGKNQRQDYELPTATNLRFFCAILSSKQMDVKKKLSNRKSSFVKPFDNAW